MFEHESLWIVPRRVDDEENDAGSRGCSVKEASVVCFTLLRGERKEKEREREGEEELSLSLSRTPVAEDKFERRSGCG